MRPFPYWIRVLPKSGDGHTRWPELRQHLPEKVAAALASVMDDPEISNAEHRDQ